ncbi:MAG: hypothetical protein PF505_01860, partial [Vallitaleaceae bacterium]|nr:hypothetical protein [Vallitaleaceae bacterium]
MIKYIKIAVGIVSFILIIIVSNLINNYSGYIITDWTIRHDDQQKEVVSLSPMDIAESGIFTFETTVKNNGFDTLVMPQVNAYALKVYVNDDIVYQVGSFDMPTSNLWNDLQIIQIGGVSKLDQYQLRIESYCLHDAGFGEQPYLTNYEDSYRILGIQRFFNNSIILIILGSYLAIGTLLIMIARRSYTNKRRDDARLFAYFGFAALMFGVFMLDSVSRLSTGSLDTLLLVRKLNLISLYIAMYLLSEGIRKFMYQKSASRILRIITALSIILILISKDFIGLVKNQQIVFPVTFLFIVYVLWLNVRAKGNVLIFSSVFLFLTTLQSFLLIFGVIEGSLTWQYGLFVYMLSIAYIVAYKYDRMELHVDKVSEELIIDPLTKAYNRAYLSRLELKDNDIAVFIDID